MPAIKSKQYDALNNRHQKNGLQHTVNKLNQTAYDGRTSYHYDRNGRRVQAGNSEYRYDALGRLVFYNDGDCQICYQYDPLGRLIKRQKGQEELNYLYQLEVEVGTYKEGLLTEFKALYGERAPFALEIGGKYYSILRTARGDLCQFEDSNGNVAATYRYDAYGLFTHYGAIESPWLFSGQRYERERGHYRYFKRDYDPAMGCWLTPDPSGFADGPNLYAYVGNNPLGFVDPYGLNRAALQSRWNISNRKRDEPKQQPKVTFDDEYEKKFQNKSRLYNLAGEGTFKELPNGGGVGFINGMNTSYNDAVAHAKYIARMGGECNIHGVYNATHGPRNDLGECKRNLCDFTATTPVRKLHQQWDNYFANNGTKKPFLQFCHSQGAILTRNGLISYSPELRQHIMVVAIAPGGYIDKELCRSVVHYVSRDPVTWCDIGGRLRCKDTIKELTPHSEASWFDHDFKSPTYEREIRKNLDDYMRME